MPTRCILALAATICCWIPQASAQDAPAEQPAAATTEQPQAPAPTDPYDRLTPRSSMAAFLSAVEEEDHNTAAEYLDTRFMPWSFNAIEGPDLARMLDFVIERRLWIDPGALSDEPEGDLADGLPRSRELLGEFKVEGENVALYLQRVPSESGTPVWKISSLTVANIANLYEQLEYAPIIHWFEEHIPEGELLGLEYFKWVFFIGSMLIAYPFAYLIGLILGRALTRKDSPIRPKIIRFFTIPVALFIVFLVGRSVVLELGLSIKAQRISRSHTLVIILVTWVILAAISLIREIITARLQRHDRLAATALLRPLANSLKVVFVLAAVLIWLDNIGYNISTLLAGLGIGGLAIALALQKPMEDFFGAITLFTQQPVRVHDFCKFGTVLGTVEEIGLRSSRIRTLDNTVVTVPNSRIAAEYIENISARQHIRYKTEIRLAYNATATQLRKVLEETRALLEGCDRVDPERTRCRFKQLGAHGFVLEALCYVQTTNYAEYLETAEHLNLGITEIVEQAGAHFAAPMVEIGGV